MKNQKGQGALEYLLLIGGAVLIAVIIIALLVGMGGGGRESAQQQADQAKEVTSVLQPSRIISVTAERDDCREDLTNASFIFSWVPSGTGGVHELMVLDSKNEPLDLNSSVGDFVFCVEDEYQDMINNLSIYTSEDVIICITQENGCCSNPISTENIKIKYNSSLVYSSEEISVSLEEEGDYDFDLSKSLNLEVVVGAVGEGDANVSNTVTDNEYFVYDIKIEEENSSKACDTDNFGFCSFILQMGGPALLFLYDLSHESLVFSDSAEEFIVAPGHSEDYVLTLKSENLTLTITPPSNDSKKLFLDPRNTSGVKVFADLLSDFEDNKCGDTYRAFIRTTKDNQHVDSLAYRFFWK